jgi:hypothetical protein
MSDRESWASKYDLFEINAGYPLWCTQVTGLTYAGFKLRQLSAKTPNECYAVQPSTDEVVARLNVRSANFRAPHVFQIAYDLLLADKLAQELPSHGYRCGYAAGNNLACAMLATPMDCDAFLLGYAAPLETRRDMAGWLNSCYPDVPIVALKSPSEPNLAAAHYNLELDGDEALLETLAQALDLRRRSD